MNSGATPGEKSIMRSILVPWLLICGLAFSNDDSAAPKLVAKPEAFETLVNPKCSHCKDEAKRRAADLRAEDRVLCWIRGYSDGGAIPLRFFLHKHRVISDTYGVFVYDPDSGFARGFAPSLDFTFYGWRNGVMAMRHKDGTVYSCLSGVAFDGPRKGSRRESVPTLTSDWGYWLDRYPGAVAYQMFDKFQPSELRAGSNPNSQRSRPAPDPRLEDETRVLGVAGSREARAYPLADLGHTSVTKDTVDGAPLLILWYAPTRTAAAYRPMASSSKPGSQAPRPVTLRVDPSDETAPFVDKETGSHWDIAGRAVSGELKGSVLPWLESTQVKWFAWAAEYPHTSIFRR